MSPVRSLLAGLSFLCLVHCVAAQFIADSLTKGDLAVWCIFDVVYVVLALLCLVPIARLQSQRWIYVALFAATLFTVVQCSVDIGRILTAQDDGPRSIVAFNSIVVFFGNWSSPLLYLSLWLLLVDRYKQWQKHDASAQGSKAMDKLLFRSLLGLFAILMLLSTISSALYANQLQLQARLVELDRVTGQDILRTQNAIMMYLKAGYVFSAFWFFSAVCVTALSVYVYQSAKHIRVRDYITKAMLFVITPLYVIGVIQSIVFTIYFSPSVTLRSEMEVEDLTLASDLISNFIYACITAAVVALGLRHEYWRAPDQIMALENLGAVPAGRYLELGDSQSNK